MPEAVARVRRPRSWTPPYAGGHVGPRGGACNDERVPAPPRVLLVVAQRRARRHAGAGRAAREGPRSGGLRRHASRPAPGPLDVGRRTRAPARAAPDGRRAFGTALRAVARRVAPDVVHGHGLRLAPFLAFADRRSALVTCHGLDPRARARTAALRAALEGPRGGLRRGPPPRARRGRGREPRARQRGPPDARLVRAAAGCALRARPRATARGLPGAARARRRTRVTLVRALAHARVADARARGRRPARGRGARRGRARGHRRPRRASRGGCDDARRCSASADVLALASVWEGQPTVVLEAMAVGRGGRRDVVHRHRRHRRRRGDRAARARRATRRSLGGAIDARRRPGAAREARERRARPRRRTTPPASSPPRTSTPTGGSSPGRGPEPARRAPRHLDVEATTSRARADLDRVARVHARRVRRAGRRGAPGPSPTGRGSRGPRRSRS